MHHMAAVPCMWSGIAMITASIFLASLSSIFRKSVYFGRFGYRLKTCSALNESTSHSATMFSPKRAHPEMSLAALPPAPMEAMFSFSFGDLKPKRFKEATLPNPPAGIAPASRLP